MSLIARMEDDLKQATLARDADRRDALRLILASLRSAEKELQRPLSVIDALNSCNSPMSAGVSARSFCINSRPSCNRDWTRLTSCNFGTDQ